MQIFRCYLSHGGSDNIGDAPVTPKKQEKPPPLMTPPQKPPCPARVDECRPASFGQPPDRGVKRLAQPQNRAEMEKMADESLEVLDSEGEGPSKKPKRVTQHMRTVLKKGVDPREIRKKTVQVVLAEHGILWGRFQKEHNKWAPVKKASACAMGGFRALQRFLLSKDCGPDGLKTLQCRPCREMISASGFTLDILNAKLDEALIGDGGIPVAEAPPVPYTSVRKKDESVGQKGQQAREDEPEPTDPFAYAKQHHPVISLLPNGTAGKAYPFRCNVCKSRRQPGGEGEKIRKL